MQVRLKFWDEHYEWGALELARLLCDLQHLCTVLNSLPPSDYRDVHPSVVYAPPYKEMIEADTNEGRGIRIAKSRTSVLKIRKSSPLAILATVLVSAAAVAAIARAARAICRVIIDLQNIRRASAKADGAVIDAARKRLSLAKDYLKLRNSLPESSRATLDESVLGAMEGLIDGRYPPIESIQISVPRPPKTTKKSRP